MKPTVLQSLSEYGRGVAGGLLFSLPMLYTEEVWMRGSSVGAGRLLAALLFTFVLLLGYNRYGGLRRDATWGEVAIDSVEELGLGIVLAGLLLWLLGRVSLSMSLQELAGRVLMGALVVAVGVSVGTAQLGAATEAETDDDDPTGTGMQGDDGKKHERPGSLTSQAILAVCGAFLIVSNIAPTVEVPIIGSQAAPWKLLLLALLSIALAGGILYFSNFIGARQMHEPLEWLAVARGVGITYALALLTAAVVLWFYGRFDGAGPVVIVAQTVTAGLPAALGASAGRLLLEA